MSNSSLKIFLVDDDPAVLASYAERLKSKGFDNVVCCADGDKVLKILPYSNVDVILSDTDMPNVDGKGLFFGVKKDKNLSSVKFVVMSGLKPVETEWVEKADAFLYKSRGFPALLDILSKFTVGKKEAEKRLFNRYKAHSVLSVDPAAYGLDAVVDVSLSGVCFESKIEFKVGDPMVVGVKAWTASQYQPVPGKIVWKKPADGSHRYGLQFEKPCLPA